MATCLLHRVLAVAEAFPERPCILDGEQTSSYGDLRKGIHSFASVVGPRVSRGDRVAILFDASLDYAAATYGTWLAGGVAVGLNAALKAEGLANLIRHCDATVLVADTRHAELKGLLGGLDPSIEVIRVSPGSWPEGRAWEASEEGPDPGDLGAILYTSGTTGRPKGVMLTHGNLAANTDSICEYLDIRPADKTLCVLPFYYSFGASILHTHLVTGAAIVVERSFMYPHDVLERAASHGISSLSGVPSTYYLLLARTDLAKYDLRSVRYCTQAGGGMDPGRIGEFRRLLPGADFIVMYGQTEATARLAWLPPEELERRPGSAGKAIPGVELKVVDRKGRTVAAGRVGEVCAKGGNVMSGYWKDPEATAEVLKDGWLFTGDLGSMDEDGFIYLRGRSREMIKSGAHRILPLEIEEVIRSVDGVQDAAVVGEPDDVLGQAVKACVIAAGDEKGLRRAVLARCREKLPLFKVPTLLEFHQDFPRTASGKVKKHVLVRSSEGR
jgi:acyl-CoA synthetase (AMP-forming)/AMP-acid ligase II